MLLNFVPDIISDRLSRIERLIADIAPISYRLAVVSVFKCGEALMIIGNMKKSYYRGFL